VPDIRMFATHLALLQPLPVVRLPGVLFDVFFEASEPPTAPPTTAAVAMTVTSIIKAYIIFFDIPQYFLGSKVIALALLSGSAPYGTNICPCTASGATFS
jgi:hypothetical protein